MDKLSIDGGARLEGEVGVSGAKNAALPILCAALLTPEPMVLSNVPRLNDVRTMQALLGQMGVKAERGDGTLALAAATCLGASAGSARLPSRRSCFSGLGSLVGIDRRNLAVDLVILHDKDAETADRARREQRSEN